MRCPNCGGSLEPRDYGVTVHQCQECSGLWFEKDELRRAKDSSDPDLRWLDFDVFAAAADAREGTRECPVCSKPMRTLTYMDSTVKIDVCDREEQEHGVWLDPGEFQKLVAYLEKTADTMDVHQYERAALTELKEVVTGPENPLSEARDLFAVLRLLEKRVSVEHPSSVGIFDRLSHLLP